jgi:hypothetical protein
MAFKDDVADDMAPIGHSVWPRWTPRLAHQALCLAPRRAPCAAPHRAPRLALVGSRKNKI